jgi:hypothetical protein
MRKFKLIVKGSYTESLKSLSQKMPEGVTIKFDKGNIQRNEIYYTVEEKEGNGSELEKILVEWLGEQEWLDGRYAPGTLLWYNWSK